MFKRCRERISPGVEDNLKTPKDIGGVRKWLDEKYEGTSDGTKIVFLNAAEQLLRDLPEHDFNDNELRMLLGTAADPRLSLVCDGNPLSLAKWGQQIGKAAKGFFDSEKSKE